MGRTRLTRARCLLLFLFALTPSGCRNGPSAHPRRLALDDVEQRLGQPNVYLFDANPRDVYDRHHVPGAKWVKFDGVRPDELPADRSAMLIFYCANEH